MDSIERNTLVNADIKTNDRSKLKKAKDHLTAAKAHVPLACNQRTKMMLQGRHKWGISLDQIGGDRKIRIQEEFQERLRHLAENLKPGKEKIKSQREGGSRSFCPP